MTATTILLVCAGSVSGLMLLVALRDASVSSARRRQTGCDRLGDEDADF